MSRRYCETCDGERTGRVTFEHDKKMLTHHQSPMSELEAMGREGWRLVYRAELETAFHQIMLIFEREVFTCKACKEDTRNP